MENPFEAIQQEIRHLRGMMSELLAKPVAVSNEPELPISVQEAAALLHMTPDGIYKCKEVPRHKKNGNLFFFRSELLAYIRGELPQSEPKTILKKRPDRNRKAATT